MIRVRAFVTIAASLACGPAAAAFSSVYFYYTPGLVVGPAAGADRHITQLGFTGAARAGDAAGLGVKFTCGFNKYHYGNLEELIITIYSTREHVSVVTAGAGPEYVINRGPISFYLGAGGAAAAEHVAHFDLYPALYLNAGVRHYLTGNWGFDAAPRYTYVFDEPVRAVGGGDLKIKEHSQFLDLLAGISYAF